MSKNQNECENKFQLILFEGEETRVGEKRSHTMQNTVDIGQYLHNDFNNATIKKD